MIALTAYTLTALAELKGGTGTIDLYYYYTQMATRVGARPMFSAAYAHGTPTANPATATHLAGVYLKAQRILGDAA